MATRLSDSSAEKRKSRITKNELFCQKGKNEFDAFIYISLWELDQDLLSHLDKLLN